MTAMNNLISPPWGPGSSEPFTPDLETSSVNTDLFFWVRLGQRAGNRRGITMGPCRRIWEYLEYGEEIESVSRTIIATVVVPGELDMNTTAPYPKWHAKIIA
jgi:hypothetical protein